ncbi:hypothetical protein C5167_025249 [Papaver somniferum]|uniref:Uncharacterized protein n=1 Tax=Papaver somniferum TaxID=3469 RepID=A0A4Y7JTX3_PAPSO|nr:hypothetical protein C5167_025249 [Papaver somniferum]
MDGVRRCVAQIHKTNCGDITADDLNERQREAGVDDKDFVRTDNERHGRSNCCSEENICTIMKHEAIWISYVSTFFPLGLRKTTWTVVSIP